MTEAPSFLYSQDCPGELPSPLSGAGFQEHHVMNQVYGAGSVIKRFAGLNPDASLPFALETLMFPENEKHQHGRYACELPVVTSAGSYQAQAYRAKGFSQIFPIGHPYYYARHLYDQLHGEFPVISRQGSIAFSEFSCLNRDACINHEDFAKSLSRLEGDCLPVYVCLSPEEYEKGYHRIYEEFGFPLLSLGHISDDDYLLRLHDIARQFSYCCSSLNSDLLILSVLSGCEPLLPPGYVAPVKNQWDELFLRSPQEQASFAHYCCGKSNIRSGEELRSLSEYALKEVGKREGRIQGDARRRARRFHRDGIPGVHPEKMDPDAWVEKEFSLLVNNLPKKFKGIELRFDFPYWFELKNQELEIFLNGELRAELRLKRGVYRVHIPIEITEKTTRLDFRFNEDFQLPGETRKRAARLGEIRFMEEVDRQWEMVKGEGLIFSESPDWDRVLIVVAPSGGGKTRMIDHLTAHANTELAQLMGIDGAESWARLDLTTMSIAAGSVSRNVLVHYELNRGFSFAEGGINFNRDQRLWDKIRNHPRKFFITLDVSADLLQERYEARRADFLVKKEMGREDYRTFFRTSHDAKMMEALYGSPEELERLYDYWFQFCLQEGFGEHWVLSGISPECEIWKLGMKEKSIQAIEF